RYIAPFATVLAFLALWPALALDPAWRWPLTVLAGGAVCLVSWPRELSLVPSRWPASIAIGLAVFLLWIAPDLLFPHYRDSAVFSNQVFGRVHSSLPPHALHSTWVLAWRTARAVLIVPVAEELFWRGWLLRWLINADFQKVRLGAYAPLSFWIAAVLFASEHGPYWDVGLLTGVVYNWWMIRSKSVASCVLMHAVTNGLLSAYVIMYNQWQYWQ
ncbi:MAG: CAAX prenyl protease-related protein, partial [Bryobacteraceae bacterium]